MQPYFDVIAFTSALHKGRRSPSRLEQHVKPAMSETSRTKLHRLSEKEVRDPEVLSDILDASYVAHLTVTDDDG